MNFAIPWQNPREGTACIYQGSYKTWKSLKVLEFENKNSSAWKSLNPFYFNSLTYLI